MCMYIKQSAKVVVVYDSKPIFQKKFERWAHMSKWAEH
jgi:hypothetical protein